MPSAPTPPQLNAPEYVLISLSSTVILIKRPFISRYYDLNHLPITIDVFVSVRLMQSNGNIQEPNNPDYIERDRYILAKQGYELHGNIIRFIADYKTIITKCNVNSKYPSLVEFALHFMLFGSWRNANIKKILFDKNTVVPQSANALQLLGIQTCGCDSKFMWNHPQINASP